MFNSFVRGGVPTLIKKLKIYFSLSQKNIPNTFKFGGNI
jgi:hypothetical protein